MSKQRKDEEYSITVDLQLPKDYVFEAEIRLINSCLGDLLKRVIRETESIKE